MSHLKCRLFPDESALASLRTRLGLIFPKDTRFVSVRPEKMRLIFLDVFCEIGYSFSQGSQT